MSATKSFARHPGFSSFKTRRNIHYPKRWMRTALIMATLDESIDELVPCPTLSINRAEVEFQFWMSRGGTFTLVLLTDFSARQLDLLDFGDMVTCVSRSEIVNHPAEAVARQVWKHSRVDIDPAIQLSVLNIIASSDDGHAQLVDLLTLGWRVEELTRQVFAMVATGLLWLDPSMPLKLSTRLRVAKKESLARNTWRKTNRFVASEPPIELTRDQRG